MLLSARSRLVLSLLFILSLLTPDTSQACTGISVKAEDGAVVMARTMEFATDLQSDLLFVPRNISWQGSVPSGKNGMKWKNRYAFIGPNFFGEHLVVDGMNEMGMYVGGFWFPGEAVYQKVTPQDYGKTLSPADIGPWLLGSFATVEEVRKGISSVKIGGVELKAMGMVPPIHWYVLDAKGNGLVIEPHAGGLQLFDNPVGVFTNAPSFDWHVTNLRNYVNLGRNNAVSTTLGKLKVTPLGLGSGMLGVPGDFTPPARFVRAAFLANSAEPAADAGEAVNLAWNLISNVSIPIGAARGVDADGKVECDYTQWVMVYDLNNREVFFRTYYNQSVRMARLKALPLDGKSFMTMPMSNKKPSYEDVTKLAH